MKPILLIMALSISFCAYSNDTLNNCRSYYYGVCLNETPIQDFNEYLELHKDNKEASIQGYHSVIWFLWADYYFNPFKKWNCFLKGKDKLEHLINNYSNNIELRFLRLTIQENLPKILGYNENINEDKTFINKNLHLVSDQDLFSRITNYLDDQKLTNTD